ncbi:MAG TPA: hypothetical protein VGW12_22075 [Pyrinomonadaceae bacterium]|nr:hypothetical protein [Pyrinomonadaceae bacterium]
MPTKASTKSKKGKSQQQQQQSFTSSYVHLGPPFAGQGPYPGGQWGLLPPPDGRSTPCPGYWAFVRRYPTVGGIVAQLGANAGTGAGSCVLYSGYQYVFKPTVSGYHFIVLTLNLGPISRSHRYGKVQVAGVLQIMGPGGHWADFYEELPSNTSATLVIQPLIQAGGTYTLRFGAAPIVNNAGYQSYGEAIVNSASLIQYLPYGAQAGKLAPPKDAKRDALLSSFIKAGGEQEAQPISLEEAATLGVGYSS